MMFDIQSEGVGARIALRRIFLQRPIQNGVEVAAQATAAVMILSRGARERSIDIGDGAFELLTVASVLWRIRQRAGQQLITHDT